MPPQVERRTVSIETLTRAAYNPRKIDKAEKAGLAASLDRFGLVQEIVVNRRTDGELRVVGGHQRLDVLQEHGTKKVAVAIVELDDAAEKALNLALNSHAISGTWDGGKLTEMLEYLEQSAAQLFVDVRLEELWDFAEKAAAPAGGDPDDVPEEQAEAVTRAGDVWVLGGHRIICGDSTVARDVAALIPAGTRAALLHADPPYGMGKEADGVENDNLYAEKLDAFQMAWWRTWRPFLADNASAYIWGTAEDLWRLWYAGGLAKSERMTFRNEVVWDKVNGMGMSSETHRQYATATERCMFFMLGEQGFNTNADNYFEGWEPIRKWLSDERERSGLTTDECNRACGKRNMTQAAFTRGGFRLILEGDYLKLREACGGVAFKREYDEIKREYDEIKREWQAGRAHFDNTHDNMRDVWNFDRVEGADRHGHATPKPVAMIVRAIKSSCPEGGVVLEPFNGSGTTLIAAETCGRICYAAELTPTYVDTTVRRWQTFTGKTATLDGDGRTFAEVAAERMGST